MSIYFFVSHLRCLIFFQFLDQVFQLNIINIYSNKILNLDINEYTLFSSTYINL